MRLMAVGVNYSGWPSEVGCEVIFATRAVSSREAYARIFQPMSRLTSCASFS